MRGMPQCNTRLERSLFSLFYNPSSPPAPRTTISHNHEMRSFSFIAWRIFWLRSVRRRRTNSLQETFEGITEICVTLQAMNQNQNKHPDSKRFLRSPGRQRWLVLISLQETLDLLLERNHLTLNYLSQSDFSLVHTWGEYSQYFPPWLSVVWQLVLAYPSLILPVQSAVSSQESFVSPYLIPSHSHSKYARIEPHYDQISNFSNIILRMIRDWEYKSLRIKGWWLLDISICCCCRAMTDVLWYLLLCQSSLFISW